MVLRVCDDKKWDSCVKTRRENLAVPAVCDTHEVRGVACESNEDETRPAQLSVPQQPDWAAARSVLFVPSTASGMTLL